MKRPLSLALGLAALITLAVYGLSRPGCAQQAPSDGMRYEVTASVGKLVDAANRPAVPTVMTMISEKPEVTIVADGEVSQGTGDIRAHAERLLGQRGRYVLQLGPLKIADIRGLVVATGAYTLRAGGGDEATAARGAVTFVMERGARRRWQVVHMHRSTTPTRAQLD